MENYDIIFSKNGNGRIKKTRWPDGESLITVLNPLKGKIVLCITEDKLREPKAGGWMDWIYILDVCVRDAERVDVIVDFHKNSDYFREFAMKLIKSTGASIIKG